MVRLFSHALRASFAACLSVCAIYAFPHFAVSSGESTYLFRDVEWLDVARFRFDPNLPMPDSIECLDLVRTDSASGTLDFRIAKSCEDRSSVRFTIQWHEFNVVPASFSRLRNTLSFLTEDELVAKMRAAEEHRKNLDRQAIDWPQRDGVAKAISDLARKMLDERAGGYSVPSPLARIDTKPTYLPNSRRPYREWSTEWIHEGWDFNAPYDTPVLAAQAGTVIRTVRDWEWSWFDRITRISSHPDANAKNLDIYRGNQVWILMADGRVAMYSHLKRLSEEMEEGQTVNRGEQLGIIGQTGVPERNFKSPHVHLEIRESPERYEYADTERLVRDAMRWPYVSKGLGYGETVTLTWQLFHYE